MTPHPYQSDAMTAAEEAFIRFQRVLLAIPTGGGKTAIFSWMAQRRLERQQQRTLILADMDELVDQAQDKLFKFTGIMAGREKAESFAQMSDGVVVGSIQTLTRRKERWPKDHFGLIVADEAHLSLASSWQGVLNYFKAQVLGVTATPYRGDRRNLGEFYEYTAYEIGLFDLIRQGFLSPIVVKSLPLSIDLSNVTQSKGDFDAQELSHVIEPYLDEAAMLLREHGSFRKTLAFLPLIATSHKFVAACERAGLRACHIDGKSPDRKDILKKFTAGEFDVLSNSMLLKQGYDESSIDCILDLSPTKSNVIYVQRAGRGTRLDPCKTDLLLLDCLWQHKKHDICRPANLIAKNKEEADAITELTHQTRPAIPGEVANQIPLDLQNVASIAQARREEALRKKLEENRNKKALHISAEEFAMANGSPQLAEYEPTMPWESKAPTEEQIKWLKKAKIDPATVKGRGHASQLLDIVMRDQKLHLAKPAQVALMRQMPGLSRECGIFDFESVTTAQVGCFFKKLKEKRQQKRLLV